jgi:hypothetical protein
VEIARMTAVVHRGDRAVRYRVQNLSAAGALLAGGPVLPVGETVEVSLYLSRRAVARLQAKVGRHQRGASGAALVALRFRHEAVDSEDQLHDALLAELENQRAPTVVLVSRETRVHAALGPLLTGLGFRAEAVRTPLEVMVELADDPGHLVGVLVDLAVGTDLLRAVAELAPGVRRGLVAVDARPAQLKLAAVGGLAQVALSPPWRSDELATWLAGVPRLAPAPESGAEPADVSDMQAEM